MILAEERAVGRFAAIDGGRQLGARIRIDERD
jgi:hypothetical protein